MKRLLARGVIGIGVLGIALQAAYMLYPHPREGWDFALRMNEVKCLLERVDPFDVWSGAVRHSPYCPYGGSANAETGEIHPVNAYPPWAYAFALPLAVLPVKTAWAIYYPLNIAFLFGLFVWGFRWCRKIFDKTEDAWLATGLSMLLLLPSIGSCFQSGNYPIPVLAATLGFVWSLNRRHDVLAGLCWALAMTKPQIAILYAVPLLMRRRWTTCLVAAAVCLAFSVPASFLCGKDVVTLIFEAVRGSAFAFTGCGTFPYFLCAVTGVGLGTNIALAAGVIVTVLLTRMLRREGDWLVIIAPAAAMSTLWTYAALYSSVMMWPVFLMLSAIFVREARTPKMWCLFLGAALFSSRLYTFVHGFTMLFPERFGYSMELHSHLDSLNSFLSLCLVVAIVRYHERASLRTAVPVDIS